MCAKFHCHSSRSVEVICSTNCDTNQQARKDLSGDSHIAPSNFSSRGYTIALKHYPFYQLPAQKKVWLRKERAVSLQMEWLVHSGDWRQQHDSPPSSVFKHFVQVNKMCLTPCPWPGSPSQLSECVWSIKCAIQIYWMTNQTTHCGLPVQLSFYISAKWLFQHNMSCALPFFLLGFVLIISIMYYSQQKYVYQNLPVNVYSCLWNSVYEHCTVHRLSYRQG